MKSELFEWLERRTPVHLSVIFPTEDARRDSRFILAAVRNLLVLDPPLGALPTLWRSAHDLRALVTRLVRARDLVVGEELQQVIDRGLYNTTLETTFSGLWDARFDHAETQDAADAIELLVSSSYPMTDGATWVKHDMALFWLTLASQNGVIDRAVAWLPLDAPECTDGLDNLYQFILSAERWAALGSPLRFLIGLLEGTNTLERLEGHPLSGKLQESLV